MAEKKRNVIGCSLLLCGLIFTALGLWRGEAGVVMQKAIHICLECIGIG
ncbi:CD1871A family CXXC motif-containing protein [Hespellia stercorisuis]|nr:CD1871A family CXXC motif-containing protein [Hespellia stercorisuis]